MRKISVSSAVILVIALDALADDKADPKVEAGFVKLFDGQASDDWEGDMSVFRIQEQSLVGGQMKAKIPHNFFLAHKQEFSDFDLRLQFKVIGENTNAGIQIRSQRIPDHHEMIGYQADLGQKYWGALYDESRRRKILAGPDLAELNKVLKLGEWNDYRIRCEGKRIQLWINDLQTVDYTEDDPAIPLTGKIALQIHGGPPGEAWYRHIRIKSLK